MTEAEYKSLDEVRTSPAVIKGSDLKDQTPRTLLYGYDYDRCSWHVYLDFDGLIHLVRYDHSDRLMVHETEETVDANTDYRPTKRSYPEDCDFEFTKLLREADAYPCFTTMAIPSTGGPFYGLRAYECKPKES